MNHHPTEEQRAALQRVLSSESEANYQTIIDGFHARGIPIEDIKPRENVLTYKAWQALGRQVAKGQKGLKIRSLLEVDKIDKSTGAKTKVRKRTRPPVFHIRQTKPIDPAAPEEPWNPPNDPEPTTEPPRAPKTTYSNGSQYPQQPTAPQAPTIDRAISLREKADNMQSAIDRKLDPAIGRQNPTSRRMSIAASMRYDAYQMQATQSALRVIADSIEAGTLPKELWDIRATSQVRKLLHGSASETTKEVLLELISNNKLGAPDPELIKKEKIKQLEAEVWAKKIPGFFPTPATLASKMIDMLDIRNGNEILEPSAGKGDLAEAVANRLSWNGLKCELTCVEVNSQLVELLELKGFEAHCASFEDVDGMVDRIVMNPPYENCIDIHHVRKAWDMLNPGGVLVALVGAGAFFRQRSVEMDFQQWIQECEIDGTLKHNEKLESAFKGPQAFKQTGVSCRLIKLQKG